MDFFDINLSYNTRLCAVGFYVVIIFLTLTGLITSKFKHNSPACKTYNNRMKSLWVLIFLFTIALAYSKIIGFVFFTVLSILAFKEFFSMIEIKHHNVVNNFLIYAVIPIQYYFLYIGNMMLFYIFIPLAMLLIVPIFKKLHGKDNNVIFHSLIIYVGLILTVYALGYMGAFLTLPQNETVDGVSLLIFILIFTLMNDFFQAVFGNVFGRHKIVPVISPNKTYEGLIGGIIASIGLGLLMRGITPFGVIETVILSAILAVAGFIGDITMSAIKRRIGVKDTGTILPGHGGLLDRFDSIMLTAPILYYYVLIEFC